MKECIQVSKNKIIPLPDSGKVINLKNPSQRKIEKIKFDGCVVKNRRAADYLISASNGAEIIFELKGRDVEHAVSQIESTAEIIRTMNLRYNPKFGAIYCKQVPAGSISINRKREHLKKKHGINIIISSSKANFCIEKISFE